MSQEDNRGMAVVFFLAGAVMGGAMGATVALLFAPQSGEETRKMIKDKAEKAGTDLKELRKNVEPKLREAKDEFSKQLSKGQTDAETSK